MNGIKGIQTMDVQRKLEILADANLARGSDSRSGPSSGAGDRAGAIL